MNNATPAVIQAKGLHRHYQRGRVKALDGMDLNIKSGRIVGLIGPNGSGKTTALKSILGLTPYKGALKVLGFDPSTQRDLLMERVCFIADVAVLPRWAKVAQMIDITQGLHPRFSREKCLTYLAQSNVRLDAKVGNLSRGMVVQLHLALVMAIDADILVLDEPTLGLDLLFRKQFYANLINDYFNENRTILITTHQVEEVEHILTDLMFIKNGRLVLDASMEDIASRYVELLVAPEHLEAAQAHQPISQRVVMGRHVLLFEHTDASSLSQLGDVRQPSIADLFVALMGNPNQEGIA